MSNQRIETQQCSPEAENPREQPETEHPQGQVSTSDLSAVRAHQRSPRATGQAPRVRIVNRRRLPGELVTRSAAIRNFCRECLGWDPAGAGSMAEAVRRCTTEECWLHQWRNGPLDNSDLEVEATSR